LKRGYMLNDLGMGSVEVIDSFDIEQEVIDLLKHKSRFGRMHSDYCKIKGMTVNQWLDDGERIPCFLAALTEEGWIKRDQDPRRSRFWHLLQGSGAKMFGVFSPREKMLIYEWIAGEWCGKAPVVYKPESTGGEASLQNEERLQPLNQRGTCISNRGNLVSTYLSESGDRDTGDWRASEGKKPSPEMVGRLIALMAPGRHHTPDGLRATRMFCSLCGHHP